jgi:ubiquinone/menaquinone biosynthesis C-methylase UbiE
MRRSGVTARAVCLAFLSLLLGSVPGATWAQQQGEHAHHQQGATHSFSDVERYAQMFESPERNRWQKPDEIIGALQLKPGAVVADVGAGTGYFSVRFARAVGPQGTVLASDLEPAMVTYLRNRADRESLANLVPVLASADNPRLPDRLSDVIFFCDTWHHISDRVAYARRLQRDLRAGGRIVIVDFRPGELPMGPPPSMKLAAPEVVAEFEQAGYRLAESLDLLPYQYILIFKVSTGSEKKP